MLTSHVLHLVAIVGLKAFGRSPYGLERALRLVRRVGGRMSPMNREQARGIAGRLRAGTCLTRAMTVSARLPGSQVVIGVRSGRSAQGFGAHAWVEHDGVPLRAFDPEGDVITRFA